MEVILILTESTALNGHEKEEVKNEKREYNEDFRSGEESAAWYHEREAVANATLNLGISLGFLSLGLLTLGIGSSIFLNVLAIADIVITIINTAIAINDLLVGLERVEKVEQKLKWQ